EPPPCEANEYKVCAILWDVMGRGTKHRLTLWLALVLALSGCATVRQALGVPSPGDPSVAIKPAETRWLLIKNPRFGDVPSEPEYIWVEEDKIPFTFTGLIDKIPLVHPVTGEVLGELDEEIGIARVTEVRERFSVANLETVASGAQIQIKDRVVAK